MARLSARLVFQHISDEKVVLVDDENGAEIVLGPAEAAGLEWFLWYFRKHAFGEDHPSTPCEDCYVAAQRSWAGEALDPEARCVGCGQTAADRINGRWGWGTPR